MSALKLEDLKRQLRAKFPKAHRSLNRSQKAITHHLSPINGAILECVCAADSTGSSLLLAKLIGACEHNRIALIDANNRFDPESYGLGMCKKLLWLRLHREEHLWKVSDWLLKDGNMSLVIMDLRELKEAQRMARSYWYRLRNHVEDSGASLVVLSASRVVPSAAKCEYWKCRYELSDLERPREQLEK